MGARAAGEPQKLGLDVDAVATLRRDESRPILDRLRDALGVRQGQVLDKSAMWRAISYQPVARVIPRAPAPLTPCASFPDLDESTDSPAIRRLTHDAIDTIAHESTSTSGCYALAQWTALACYVDDGRLLMDNNLAESALRGIAVGRKNWLFVGHEEAGRKGAVILSLVRTCEMIGVDPKTYLNDVLTRIAVDPTSRA